MRAHLTAPLLPALFLSLLMSGGCFNPEYGYGGFLCGKGQCPEGYGCVCTAGKKTCAKGAVDKPCPAPDGPITQLDGGGKDGSPKPAPTCTTPAEITTDVRLGFGTFDLVLDHADTPSVVWVNAKGAVEVMSKAQGVTTWPPNGIPLSTANTEAVAAAANSKKHIHIIYPEQSKTSSGGALWHAFMDLGNATPTWSAATEIVQMDTADVSLAASPTLSSDVYLAAAEKGGAGKPARKLVGRLALSGSSYGYTPVCNNTTADTYSTPRITLGKRLAGQAEVGFSFHNETKKGWELSHFNPGGTTCPAVTPLNGGIARSPAPVAWDGLGGLQIAWGLPDNSKRALGPLKWLIWSPGKNITAGSETTISANTITDPHSVSLAIRGIEPCIASWEYVASPSKSHLKVMCSDGPQSWPTTTSIDHIGVSENDYRGYQTRLLADSKGVLHLVYLVHTVDGTTHKASLKYVSCN